MNGDLDPPRPAVVDVVARALAEDLGVLGDITSLAAIDPNTTALGVFVARADGILAGTCAATEVFAQLEPTVEVQWLVGDGAEITPGQDLGRVTGPQRVLLGGERSALNLLTHCSGIATLTRRYVRAAQGRARILDTRKTLPGLRALERAAVRAGGGFNHRDSLSDAVLLKDNHLGDLDVRKAVSRARARWPGRMVEVECETLADVDVALAAGADRVMLDNMAPEAVAEAVARVAGAVPTEVSGGVTLETIGDYAAAGATFVSIGAITHSAPALDIALDFR